MTPTATATRLTAEEFQAFVERPENESRWFELVRGEVIELPPPKKPHGIALSNFARILGNHSFDVGGVYVVSGDSGVILRRNPDTVRGPDVAVYTDGKTSETMETGYSESIPALVVEILSPSDTMTQVTKKVTEYIRAGTKVVWVADPENRSVIVNRPGELPAVADEDEELTCPDVLPGFTRRVADFFAVPADRPKPTP